MGPTRQSYEPFRASLLGKEDIRRLSRPQPRVALRDIAVHWALILLAFSMAAANQHPLLIAALVVVIGVNMYGLLIIGHDGLHRRLFANPRMNDRVNDLLVIGPVGAITRINNANHMEHHRHTCLAGDPDRHKYTHPGKEPTLPFLTFLTGLSNAFPTLRNIFLGGGRAAEAAPTAKPPRQGYRWTDLAILIGWQAVLFIGLTGIIGWWAYPVLWLLPLYVFCYLGDLLRVFCEHAMLTDDISADEGMRLVTFRSNWIERLFFAPHGMNFHMPHHLWPSIPYYNLAEADRLIRERNSPNARDPRLVWRTSYVAHIGNYYRWRLHQAERRSPASKGTPAQ